MTDNVIKTLQTELAQDLVKFEQQADDGTFNEEELKLIVAIRAIIKNFLISV